MAASFGVVGFVNQGIQDDDRKFEQSGIDGFSTNALPYYARWIRQDLVGVFFVLNRIAGLALLNAVLLAVIAVALWTIALR